MSWRASLSHPERGFDFFIPRGIIDYPEQMIYWLSGPLSHSLLHDVVSLAGQHFQSQKGLRRYTHGKADNQVGLSPERIAQSH